MPPLQKGTVALRVSSAVSTDRRRPFGKCGCWFTRTPIVVEVATIGAKRARSICSELHLVVEQLSELPKSSAEPHERPEDDAKASKPAPRANPPGVPSAALPVDPPPAPAGEPASSSPAVSAPPKPRTRTRRSKPKDG